MAKEFDNSHDMNENQNGSVKDDSNKKLEIEKEEIIRCVANADTDTLIRRVAWVLNHYPEARDSDITCMLKYWSVFESDIYNHNYITSDDLYKLTRLTSITRARAHIQNTYRLFLASPDVRKRRGVLEDEEKNKSIEQKSHYPVYSVYADESGKTADYLIVGSMWILNGIDTYRLNKAIQEWRKEKGFKEELHFHDIGKENINYYRQVLLILKEYSTAISFKALSVERRGIRNKDEAFMLLYYYMLINGIDHENDTGRAPLPRNIQLWKDAEEPGFDKLMLVQIRERLEQTAKIKYEDKLVVDEIIAVDSKSLVLIQLADLFTSSINRILNATGDRSSPKDQFANEFLYEFGLSRKCESHDIIGDCVFYSNL